MSSSLNRVFLKLRHEGIQRALIDSYTILYDKLYDIKYGIDTYSWVPNKDLDGDDYALAHASMYQASKVIQLRKVFGTLNIPKGKVMVDIGGGKGRVLLVASEFGFKAARGVEFSPSLCAIAENNIRIYKARTKTNTHFEIINLDASLYQFNDDEYLIFLYNPFDEIILSDVVKNLQASLKRHPRDILMVYKYADAKRKFIEDRFTIKNIRNLIVLGGDYVVYDI